MSLHEMTMLLKAQLDGRDPSFSNFTVYTYLDNVTGILDSIGIRLRHHDVIMLDMDSSAGLLYLVMVPLVYFLCTALMLGCLLGGFWYIDKGSRQWTGRSSMSTLSRGTLRDLDSDDGGFTAGKYRTRMAGGKGEGHDDAPGGWSVRSSVRTSRRNTTNDNLKVALGARMSARGVGSVRSVDALKEKIKRKRKSNTLETRSMTSVHTMSSESLDGQVALDLKSSMESQKLLWSPRGELRPDALYGKSRCNMDLHGDANFVPYERYNASFEDQSPTDRDNRSPVANHTHLVHHSPPEARDRMLFSPGSTDSINRGTTVCFEKDPNPLNDQSEMWTASRMRRLLEESKSREYYTLTYSEEGRRTQPRTRDVRDRINHRPGTPMPADPDTTAEERSDSKFPSKSSVLLRVNEFERNKAHMRLQNISRYTEERPSSRHASQSSSEGSYVLPPVAPMEEFQHWDVQNPDPYPGQHLTPYLTTRPPKQQQQNTPLFEVVHEANSEGSSGPQPPGPIWPNSSEMQEHSQDSHEDMANFVMQPYGGARACLSGGLSSAYSTSQLELVGTDPRRHAANLHSADSRGSRGSRGRWGPLDSTVSSTEGSEDNISLSDSISRFRADKNGQVQESPKSKFRFGAMRGASSQRDSVTSSATGDLLTDNASTCPRLGSMQSLYTESLSAPDGLHHRHLELSQDLSTCVEPGMDNSGFIPDVEAELVNEAHEYRPIRRHQGPNADTTYTASHYGNGDTATAPSNGHPAEMRAFKGLPPVPVIREGKVSTKERLREYGFIKMVGRKKYVVNPSPGKFFRRASSSTLGRVRKSSVIRRLQRSPSPRRGQRGDLEEAELLMSEPRVRGKPPRGPRSGHMSA